jgi:hypothetical protein
LAIRSFNEKHHIIAKENNVNLILPNDKITTIQVIIMFPNYFSLSTQKYIFVERLKTITKTKKNIM